jgi:glycosyltransferase involved in cell wall biosynthesis
MNYRPELNVLLVSNYEYDRQESMLRFANLLLEKLADVNVGVQVMRPTPFFGRMRPSPVGIGKWLGYLDKFLVFPWQLRMRVSRELRSKRGSLLVHICDHSNAVYCGVANAPTVVTCHDLLAVKGALGTDPNCPASWSGRILQKLILAGLQRADFVVCDSAATREDLLELSAPNRAENSDVVLLAQNHPYKELSIEESERRLHSIQALRSRDPYVLTVGSNLSRKNRDGALRIFAKISGAFSGQMVFAGEALDDRLRALATDLGIAERLVEVTKPSNDVLEALYSQAFALLYPSKCEGFGWPIIEAQACGCPVVCSDRTSVPEVAGDGALVCDLDDEDTFAACLLKLRDEASRQELVRKGFANLSRFHIAGMIDRYHAIYRRLADIAPEPACVST